MTVTASTRSTEKGGFDVKHAILIAAALLTASAVGCGSNQVSTSEPRRKSPEAIRPAGSAEMKTVDVHADRAILFKDIAQLADRSDIAVYGKVETVDYVDFNGVTYTRLLLRVEVPIGSDEDIKSGDTITVVEPGGVTTVAALIESNGNKFAEIVGEEDRRTKVKVTMDGAPLTQAGDSGVFFLAKGDLGVLATAYYDVVGATEGKLLDKNGTLRRYVSPSEQGLITDLASDKSGVLNKAKAAFEAKGK